MGQREKEIVRYDWSICEKFTEFVRAHKQSNTVDVVIGILKGGAIPAVVVANVLSVPVYWVRYKSYDGYTQVKPEFDNFNVKIEHVKGKHVMVVDDIWDTGDTMINILELIGLYEAVKVTGCVMVTKDSSLDHRGYQVAPLEVVDKNDWVIFPWE